MYAGRSYAQRRPLWTIDWRKVTWKRINNFRFGSTAKVNYVILITDSETFKLKHFPKFPAYFMLKRLKSSSALPQKLEKSSKNLQKVSKIHQENRYRWNGYFKTPADNRDTNHSYDFTAFHYDDRLFLLHNVMKIWLYAIVFRIKIRSLGAIFT